MINSNVSLIYCMQGLTKAFFGARVSFSCVWDSITDHVVDGLWDEGGLWTPKLNPLEPRGAGPPRGKQVLASAWPNFSRF